MLSNIGFKLTNAYHVACHRWQWCCKASRTTHTLEEGAWPQGHVIGLGNCYRHYEPIINWRAWEHYGTGSRGIKIGRFVFTTCLAKRF